MTMRCAVADVDLEPVAVMLQLMRPARSCWGLLGDDWLTRMDETAGALIGAATVSECHSYYGSPFYLRDL